MNTFLHYALIIVAIAAYGRFAWACYDLCGTHLGKRKADIIDTLHFFPFLGLLIYWNHPIIALLMSLSWFATNNNKEIQKDLAKRFPEK